MSAFAPAPPPTVVCSLVRTTRFAQKPHEGTVCPQCGVVYREGRWRWVAWAEGIVERCARLAAASTTNFLLVWLP
jgi:hypothetical protein